MIYAGKTDIGLVRNENQDSFALCEPIPGCVLALVCDGMGGAAGGKTASSTAVNSFVQSITSALSSYVGSASDITPGSFPILKTMLTNAVNDANTSVYQKACNEPELKGMGTTLVGALVFDEHAFVINVGDSRLYSFSDRMLQITKDHSFVQYLVDMGTITSEEAKTHPYKNRITRAVGVGDHVESDLFHIPFQKGTTLLLCSDGLCGFVESEEMETIVYSDKTISEKADKLISLANDAGGHDNVTALLVTY